MDLEIFRQGICIEACNIKKGQQIHYFIGAFHFNYTMRYNLVSTRYQLAHLYKQSYHYVS